MMTYYMSCPDDEANFLACNHMFTYGTSISEIQYKIKTLSVRLLINKVNLPVVPMKQKMRIIDLRMTNYLIRNPVMT